MGEPEELSQTWQLVEHSRDGDRAAREALFSRLRPRLAAFLRQRLPTHARALDETQDLVQDVCIKAFQHLERFQDRGLGSFWMFLRATARNHLIDVVRHRKHEREKEPIPEESRAAPAAADRSPFATLDAHEVAAAFERALEKLPERTATAVVMRLELDFDYATIAVECGFPSPDAVRVAIARAITQIAQEMRPHDPAREDASDPRSRDV